METSASPLVRPRPDFNITNYEAFSRSDTVRCLKEGALHIVTALAIITIVGGVLGALALNGVNLGPLNTITHSFTSLIGAKFIYVGLAAGLSVLFINTVLTASLARSYSNKQFSEKEIERLNLKEWLRDEQVLAKLEPGTYWRFPEQLESVQPATQNHPGRDACFGFIVRHPDGRLGLFAFRTEADAAKKTQELGYSNGEVDFDSSPTYTEGYVFSIASSEQRDQIKNFQSRLETHLNPALKENEYITEHVSVDVSGDEDFYLLVTNEHGIQYFKTDEMRKSAIQTQYTHFFDRGLIDECRTTFETPPGYTCIPVNQHGKIILYNNNQYIACADQNASEQARSRLKSELSLEEHYVLFKNEWIKKHVTLERFGYINQIANEVCQGSEPYKALNELRTGKDDRGFAFYTLIKKNADQEPQVLFFAHSEEREKYIHSLSSQSDQSIEEEEEE